MTKASKEEKEEKNPLKIRRYLQSFDLELN